MGASRCDAHARLFCSPYPGPCPGCPRESESPDTRPMLPVALQAWTAPGSPAPPHRQALTADSGVFA